MIEIECSWADFKQFCDEQGILPTDVFYISLAGKYYIKTQFKTWRVSAEVVIEEVPSADQQDFESFMGIE